MDFIKETSVKGAFIPRSALTVSGFQGNEEATLHTLPGTVILTRRHMTAMELVQTIDSISQTAADLLTALAKLCGPCDDCNGDGCPYDDMGDDPMDLPDFLREDAGIPEKAKLCAEVDSEAHTVTFMVADHQHDLQDVPEGQLALLSACGICLGALEEKLMTDEVIYHG